MKVSIYILNHNYERYLDEAITSVLGQDYDDIEVLLIDDGSTDNSIDLIQKKYLNNPKIHFTRNIENQGLIRCCNQALRIASGDLILRLDADDVLELSAISKLVDFFVRHKALFQNLIAVFGDYIEIDQTGHTLKEVRKQSTPAGDADFLVPIHGACTLIDIHWLRSIGGYDDEFSRQDGFYIWAQASAFDKKILGCEQVIFQYRKHQMSLSAAWSRILDQRNLIAEKIVTKQLNRFSYDILLPVRAADFVDSKDALTHIIDLLRERFVRPQNVNKIYVVSSSETVFNIIKNCLPHFNVAFRKRSEELEAVGVTLRQSLTEIDIYKSTVTGNSFALIMTVAATLVPPRNISLLVNQAVIFRGFDAFIIGRIIKGDIYQPSDGGLSHLSENNQSIDEYHCLVERTPGVVLVRESAWADFISDSSLSVGLAESI